MNVLVSAQLFLALWAVQVMACEDMGQCYYRSGHMNVPNMADVPATHEISLERCQARCVHTTDCLTFSFEFNPTNLAFPPKLGGICNLQGADAWRQEAPLSVATGPKLFPSCCTNVTKLVSMMITFGAPAISWPAASNPGSRCIPGYRFYTQNDPLPGGGYGIQEDAAAMYTRFPHAKTNVVMLRDGKDSEFKHCIHYPVDESQLVERMPLWQAAVYHDWAIHSITSSYAPRIKTMSFPELTEQQESELERKSSIALKLAIMADATYTESLDGSINAVRDQLPGYRLVGFALVPGGGLDKDAVLVIQNEATLGCTINFEGSYNIADLNSFASDYGTGYCGFRNTHVGVRNELWTITANHEYQAGIRPVLPQCKYVTCVGHSLGGALCELFTLCANSNSGGDPDYDKLAWTPGNTKLMDWLVSSEGYALGHDHQLGSLSLLTARDLQLPASPTPTLGLAVAAAASLVALAVYVVRKRAGGVRSLSVGLVSSDSSDSEANVEASVEG
jgi:hypothetical protein